MAEKIKSRQQQILELLLENKTGLSIDEVAGLLDISRNAVQQHFATLERDGYIQTASVNKTAGRPVRSFMLTEAGINSFPKQYAWFSELILTDLKNELGSEGFERYLDKLAKQLAETLLPQFNGKSTDERVAELLKVMDSLGFNSKRLMDNTMPQPMIEACNCIYHDLAQKHNEVCQFDRTLISYLLDKDIEQVECMAKGGAVCCFKVVDK